MIDCRQYISSVKMKCFFFFVNCLIFYYLIELEHDGFCQNPYFECLVAEVPEEHKSKEGKSVDQSHCGLPCQLTLNLSASYTNNKRCVQLLLMNSGAVSQINSLTCCLSVLFLFRA